jgi:hypothetical protein
LEITPAPSVEMMETAPKGSKPAFLPQVADLQVENHACPAKKGVWETISHV